MHTYTRVSRTPKRRWHSGFTLPELMVVLALAAVILSLAVPNFRSFIQNGRLTTAANDLLVSIHLARTEAVKRQRPVAVCATADSGAAVPVCSGGAFTAWVVWVDDDDDWQPDADVDEVVLERHPALDASMTVKVNAGESGVLKFLPTGFAALGSAGFVPTERVAMCDARGMTAVHAGEAAARALLITQTGRARVTRDATEIENALNAMGVADCP